ncbi:MAG: hypothetical protein IJT44_08200 [Clostridia bacterium]|nr:hypothetical protein [Clostridia bacterium]
MAIFESALEVILKAFAWITTSNASQYAYNAATALMNLLLKIAGNVGLE